MNLSVPDWQSLPAFFRRVASGDLFRWRDTFAEYLTSTGRYNSEDDVIKNFEPLVKDLRGWMKAKGYNFAEAVLDYTLEKKAELVRKDGKTPSALHEVTQAVWFISCIEDGLHVDDPEGILAVIFSHDLGEDFGVLPEDLSRYLRNERGFMDSLAIDEFLENFDVISKRYGKTGAPRYKNDYEYYLAIQKMKNASVAKMIDRAHNIMTLIGVKENEGPEDKMRMTVYVAKTLQLQSDYVRDASLAFPSQAEIYKALEFVIEQEAQVCRYYIVDTGKKITDDNDLRSEMPDKGFKKLPKGFHPLIFAAERIRHTYPETHLAKTPAKDADLDHGIVSGSGGSKGSGSGSSDSAGGAAGSRTGTDDIPDLNR